MAAFNLPAWIKWIAQDKNGAIWGFEAEPHLHDYGWYENEVGRYKLLMQSDICHCWEDSLTTVDNLSDSSLAKAFGL